MCLRPAWATKQHPVSNKTKQPDCVPGRCLGMEINYAHKTGSLSLRSPQDSTAQTGGTAVPCESRASPREPWQSLGAGAGNLKEAEVVLKTWRSRR